jgi:hypothetical protein
MGGRSGSRVGRGLSVACTVCIRTIRMWRPGDERMKPVCDVKGRRRVSDVSCCDVCVYTYGGVRV